MRATLSGTVSGEVSGIVAALVWLIAVWPAAAQSVQQGLRVPAGFEVIEFADSQLANDIFTLTINPRGQVVVSGPGYLRILVEDEKTGKAAHAIDIGVGNKDGAQGLFWEGDLLYYMADGGLRRIRVGEDGKAIGSSELVRAMKTGGEHHSHAIRRGPDGWLYVLAGNTTGIDKSYATLATSPIKQPVAGCLMRFSPDLKNSEIVADGFRNAYDFDFNLDGEAFTFDSDNERCVSLPWYEGTRFYHVIPGGHYGWQAPQHGTFFRLPPSMPDVVPPLMDLGRGSPTGVACYRHVQFPEEYRGGIFLADWTFGRIFYMTLKQSGASYTTEKQVFLQSTGDNGFAPTAVAVHPTTGELYISIGGRGTRGGVYRIRYPQGAKIDPAALAKMKVVQRSLDWNDGSLRVAREGDPIGRLRALIEIRRNLSRVKSEDVLNAIQANWDHEDREVCRAAADLIAVLPQREREQLYTAAKKPRQQTTWCLGGAVADPDTALKRATELLPNNLIERVRIVRAVQLALGGIGDRKQFGKVWEAYSVPPGTHAREHAGALGKVLEDALASGPSESEAEVGRTLAMLEDGGKRALERVVLLLQDKPNASLRAIETIHYLAVAGRLTASRTQQQTDTIGTALIRLDEKIVREKLQRDSYWPLRIAELHAGLAEKDPKLNAAMLGHKDFGRPDHALFTRCPGFDRAAAAKIFLARSQKDTDFAWNADIVKLMAELPASETFPVLRKLWGQAGLEETILPVLAKQPDAADREKFLHGLSSPQPATVRICLDSLEKLSAKDVEPKHLLSLILALRRLGDSKEEKQLAVQLGGYLEKLTGQAKLGTDKQAWADWFAMAHPALAARLAGPDGVDIAAWNKRIAQIDFEKGDAERGGKVYVKANCASCHSGTQAIGPDLRGVTSRFSRADLMTAIIQPSKDIAVRYRTTAVETASGKIYQGIIIYESVDSVILQTGPAATVRVDGAQITGKRFTDVSLMPAGLLDVLKNEEVADLVAYLRSLTDPGKK